MKYLYTNTTGGYVYPQGKALPPGESVELDSDQCPEFMPEVEGKKTPPKKIVDPDAGLKTLLAQNANDAVAEIESAPADALPAADLKTLEALESARKEPRKSVLAAITEALLKRAESAAGA